MTGERKLPPLTSLLDRISRATTEAYDRDRKSSPHRFTGAPDGLGAEFLFVENVARMLGCNVDHVRRIPRAELPASRVGTRLIYSRTDVEGYIAHRREAGLQRDTSTRRLQPVAAAERTQHDVPTFDPVQHVQQLLKGVRGDQSEE